MYVAKTKALISFTVTAKLICAFVFAYANRWFSHDAAHLLKLNVTSKDIVTLAANNKGDVQTARMRLWCLHMI